MDRIQRHQHTQKQTLVIKSKLYVFMKTKEMLGIVEIIRLQVVIRQQPSPVRARTNIGADDITIYCFTKHHAIMLLRDVIKRTHLLIVGLLSLQQYVQLLGNEHFIPKDHIQADSNTQLRARVTGLSFASMISATSSLVNSLVLYTHVSELVILTTTTSHNTTTHYTITHHILEYPHRIELFYRKEKRDESYIA